MFIYIRNLSLKFIFFFDTGGRRGRDRMIVDLQLHMPPMPITTNVVSLNPAQARCTTSNIMWWSLSGTCDRSVVFSGYSNDRHDITEMLLKVTLNTIAITLTPCCRYVSKTLIIIIFLWCRYWLRTLMQSVFPLIQVFINTMIVRHGLMYLISSNIQTSIQKLSLSASMNQQEKHIMTNLQVVSMSMHNVCLLCSWNSPFSFA